MKIKSSYIYIVMAEQEDYTSGEYLDPSRYFIGVKENEIKDGDDDITKFLKLYSANNTLLSSLYEIGSAQYLIGLFFSFSESYEVMPELEKTLFQNSLKLFYTAFQIYGLGADTNAEFLSLLEERGNVLDSLPFLKDLPESGKTLSEEQLSQLKKAIEDYPKNGDFNEKMQKIAMKITMIGDMANAIFDAQNSSKSEFEEDEILKWYDVASLNTEELKSWNNELQEIIKSSEKTLEEKEVMVKAFLESHKLESNQTVEPDLSNFSGGGRFADLLKGAVALLAVVSGSSESFSPRGSPRGSEASVAQQYNSVLKRVSHQFSEIPLKFSQDQEKCKEDQKVYSISLNPEVLTRKQREKHEDAVQLFAEEHWAKPVYNASSPLSSSDEEHTFYQQQMGSKYEYYDENGNPIFAPQDKEALEILFDSTQVTTNCAEDNLTKLLLPRQIKTIEEKLDTALVSDEGNTELTQLVSSAITDIINLPYLSDENAQIAIANILAKHPIEITPRMLETLSQKKIDNPALVGVVHGQVVPTAHGREHVIGLAKKGLKVIPHLSDSELSVALSNVLNAKILSSQTIERVIPMTGTNGTNELVTNQAVLILNNSTRDNLPTDLYEWLLNETGEVDPSRKELAINYIKSNLSESNPYKQQILDTSNGTEVLKKLDFLINSSLESLRSTYESSQQEVISSLSKHRATLLKFVESVIKSMTDTAVENDKRLGLEEETSTQTFKKKIRTATKPTVLQSLYRDFYGINTVGQTTVEFKDIIQSGIQDVLDKLEEEIYQDIEKRSGFSSQQVMLKSPKGEVDSLAEDEDGRVFLPKFEQAASSSTSSSLDGEVEEEAEEGRKKVEKVEKDVKPLSERQVAEVRYGESGLTVSSEKMQTVLAKHKRENRVDLFSTIHEQQASKSLPEFSGTVVSEKNADGYKITTSYTCTGCGIDNYLLKQIPEKMKEYAQEDLEFKETVACTLNLEKFKSTVLQDSSKPAVVVESTKTLDSVITDDAFEVCKMSLDGSLSDDEEYQKWVPKSSKSSSLEQIKIRKANEDWRISLNSFDGSFIVKKYFKIFSKFISLGRVVDSSTRVIDTQLLYNELTKFFQDARASGEAVSYVMDAWNTDNGQFNRTKFFTKQTEEFNSLKKQEQEQDEQRAQVSRDILLRKNNEWKKNQAVASESYAREFWEKLENGFPAVWRVSEWSYLAVRASHALVSPQFLSVCGLFLITLGITLFIPDVRLKIMAWAAMIPAVPYSIVKADYISKQAYQGILFIQTNPVSTGVAGGIILVFYLINGVAICRAIGTRISKMIEGSQSRPAASASGRNASSHSLLGLPVSNRGGIPSFSGRKGGYTKHKFKKSTNKNRKANKTKKPRHTRHKKKKSKHNSSQKKKNNKKTKTKKHRHTIRHK